MPASIVVSMSALNIPALGKENSLGGYEGGLCFISNLFIIFNLEILGTLCPLFGLKGVFWSHRTLIYELQLSWSPVLREGTKGGKMPKIKESRSTGSFLIFPYFIFVAFRNEWNKLIDLIIVWLFPLWSLYLLHVFPASEWATPSTYVCELVGSQEGIMQWVPCSNEN